MIVILGATLAEARYWKAHYIAAFPELKEAQEISTGGGSYQVQGMHLKKVYIAPGVREGNHFPEVFDVVRRNLLKTPGSVDPIYLGTRLAGLGEDKT